MNRIGLRREDKNRWERRAPLSPGQVSHLVREDGIPFVVQPSPLRTFEDAEYRSVGAEIREDLGDCDVILGVKEVPPDLLIAGKTYAFFSHTTKGQDYNMPLLRRILELGCTLIDYEKGVDEAGRRLFFFGRQAGLVGALESMRALGLRLESEGHPTPLLGLRPAREIDGLDHLREVVAAVGSEIRSTGLPPEIGPLVVGLTGDGHVSRGAREILGLLTTRRVRPSDLATLRRPSEPVREILVVVFTEPDIVRPRDPQAPFDLREYYERPERYRPILEPYLRHVTVLLHCSYWEPRYPRVLTAGYVRRWWREEATPRLRVVGDLSCDVDGGVQINRRVTTPDEPFYVYDPETGETTDGVSGHGPAVLAVDNLPCLLPRVSTESFGDALAPYLRDIAKADLRAPTADAAGLPGTIRRAVVAWRGRLEPAYGSLEALAR